MKGYVIPGKSSSVPEWIFSPQDELIVVGEKDLTPVNCNQVDFVCFVFRWSFVDHHSDLIAEFMKRFERNGAERLFPVFVIVEGCPFPLFKTDRMTILIPEAVSDYHRFLRLFHVGCDVVASSVEELRQWGPKALQFFSQFRRVVQARETALRHSSDTLRVKKDFLQLVAELVETFDGVSVNHVVMTGRVAFDVARKLGFSEEDAREIAYAVKIHDVGKLFLPKELLGSRVEAQSKNEHMVFRNHTTGGHSYVLKVLSGESRSVRDRIAMGVLCHHENWDGTGYPAGMSGDRIPIEAAIARIVDFGDTIQRKRGYRNHILSPDEVFEVIRGAKAFHPEVKKAYLEVAKRHYSESRAVISK